MTDLEREQHHRRIDAEIVKLFAETSKPNAETAKLTSANRLYLLVVGSGSTLAIAAFATLFL
ncbi:hypothetical protein SAMN05421853_102286 [Roseivivax halotolerans]|uniref:Uncharacterized protein n=1 Tax=Roseivivax halotolerans TaxID=93684 RepID=A0A1I5WEB9_9RHOB|nr:hypothetical protein [Roseivivax halotolerans]SFQ17988.1 hypothetical protein SAMN05421853_102286 [Roseivivax halotolerans]